MATNDPFAEPDDGERTVIRPNPGGRRGAAPGGNPFGAAPAAPATPSQPAGAAGGAGAFGVPDRNAGGAAAAQVEAQPMTGMNTLVACGAPLFALISRIRNRAQHVDPDKLRQAVVAEVRGFESRALQAGIEATTVKVARYALCATLDDVVLNTPWGSQSSWAMQSMVGTFHRETVGGDRFYDLLARLEKDPAGNIDQLEFLYTCLSLGFEGRLRVEDRGSEKHLAIRAALARIIRGQRGAVEHDLSPSWKGLDKPHKARSWWKPVWIAVGTAALLAAIMFGSLSWILGQRTSAVAGALSSLDSGRVAELQRKAPPPPPPPPTPVAVKARTDIAGFLAPEIKEGIVEVFDKDNNLVVRLAGSGFFASGSDQLTDKFVAPVQRVAEALKDEKGPVIVAGYSDNIPLSGRGRFKDNAALSLARAQSVAKILAQSLGGFDRISAEGRGEKDPIADNKTKEGRAKNRRIEILLVKQEEN